MDSLIGDVVIWSRKAGPVTEIHFRSGHALFLVDTGLIAWRDPWVIELAR